MVLTGYFFLVDGGAAIPAAKRPAVQMPDEYLPPNKILFLQNLPESVTKDQLNSLFSQCVSSSLIPFFSPSCPHWLQPTDQLTDWPNRLIDLSPHSDIPTYTKSVSFRQRRTSHSWSTSTRGVRVWRRMRCTITSWTGRTRSRCVLVFDYFFALSSAASLCSLRLFLWLGEQT